MDNTRIVAVCGGSGSGKSTIVRYLEERMGAQECITLTMDHYYRDQSHLSAEERQALNFDSPEAMDLEALHQHLLQLKQGQSIEQPRYCFATHTRKQEVGRCDPSSVIVLDGILALHSPEIRNLVDMKIFVTVDADLRFIRRLARDVEERGRSSRSVIDQYLSTVRPMYMKYVEPQRDFADHVVDWTEYNYQRLHEIFSEFHPGFAE